MAEKAINNTDFEKEIESRRQLAESMYVASIYSDVDLYKRYPLEVSHFKKGTEFWFYFMMAKKMIDSGYEVLDMLSVDEFIGNQRAKTQQLYEDWGGYDTITLLKDVIEPDNIEQQYYNVLKFSAIDNLYRSGFDVSKNWDEITHMNYNELKDYITAITSDVFANSELGNDRVVDIKSGLHDMLVQADKGVMRGYPYRSKLLTKATHGMRRGEMTILAAKSGEGKSFLTTMLMLPTLIEYREPVLIICNEEDMAKWQREIITQIINEKIANKDNRFSKGRFFEGGFTDEEWEMLREAEEMFNEMIEDELVMFVNLTTFSMDKSIELIKKYSSKHDIRYYILDTLKLDNDIGSGTDMNNSWLALQQSSVKLYNTIKEGNRNSHILLTYQLNKQNTKRLTMESLGISKNIVDVASTVILARNLYPEEKKSDSGGIVVKNEEGSTVKLNEDRDYMLLFLVKNRAGSTSGEIVLRTDKAYNMVKDIGVTQIEGE